MRLDTPGTAVPENTLARTDSATIAGSARPPRSHARLGRVVAAGAIAAALVLGAAACSTGGSDAASAADTRTVSTAHGDVKVPAHPLRVVSVHSWTTESLYDLGVKPIAVEDGGAEYVPSRYLTNWKAAKKISSGADVDLEQIAALKPDLIVGVDVPYLTKLYPKLEAIAPTAFAAFDGKWTTPAIATADFINDDAALTKLQGSYTSKLDEIRSTYGEQLKTAKWDVIQGGFDEGNYWIYGEKSSVGTILTDLDAPLASASAAVKDDNSTSVSYEQAALLSDADYIIYYANNDGTPANNIQNLFDLQAYKQLPAVTAGHVIGTSDFLTGSYADAIGVLDAIEQVLKTSAK